MTGVEGTIVFAGEGARATRGCGDDHVFGAIIKTGAAGVDGGNIKSFDDQPGTTRVHGVLEECVDDLHERNLHGFFVFDERDRV